MLRLRMMALLLIAAMLMSCAMAEGELPETAAEARQALESDEVHAFVEALFLAATGTTYESETMLREELGKLETAEAEIQARNEACALYRAKTLPWLKAAVAMEAEIDAEATSEPTPEPTPTPDPMQTPDPEASVIWTVEDGYAAFSENEFGRQYLELLKAYGGGDWETDLGISREIFAMWMDEINHAELRWMNDDYVFWLYGPGTQIDYPVVQCGNNDYYLRRMFNRSRNAAGTLFVDYRNLPDFQDPNTLIYGHHMRNDSMFGTLTEYERQAYYEAHPYMLIISAEEMYLAELFAGYTTTKRDHCYDIAISDEQDMINFILQAKEKSDFVCGVQPGVGDTLVTFSTCAYAFDNARYIVIGKLNRIEKYVPDVQEQLPQNEENPYASEDA